jgi:hypothetical protein
MGAAWSVAAPGHGGTVHSRLGTSGGRATCLSSGAVGALLSSCERRTRDVCTWKTR